MSIRPDTLTSCDLALSAVRDDYVDAVEHGNALLAEILGHRLDELLDLRLHLPAQR